MKKAEHSQKLQLDIIETRVVIQIIEMHHDACIKTFLLFDIELLTSKI